MNNRVKSEDRPKYRPDVVTDDNVILRRAMEILAKRLRAPGEEFSRPEDVERFLVLKLAEEEREIFSALFLDNRHRLIKYEELFYGTIDGAAVYPREVVKRALALNANALILAHNHPSGGAEPSRADEAITRRLKEALELVDIRVLDHIVVGNADTVSFAKRGLL